MQGYAMEARERGTGMERNRENGGTAPVLLGIDCGSTTAKFVLMDEKGKLLDSYYGPNEGDPLKVLRKGLIAVRDRARKAGAELSVIAAGSTGYGELLTAKAFGTEFHMVETVAHARAAAEFEKDVSFILDIGGQDMKAIWVNRGIVTNIVVNEACSSGCGSFLESLARTLRIPVYEIAETAFRSESPAALGSRCTVFMNSSIITEQRNGKGPGDIMAGLCRSIIENAFTKVIRVSNIASLGEHIVVQGGTFRNDAVLRAMEQYIGKSVKRAPCPGLMGAIGAALLVKEQTEEAAGCEKAIRQAEAAEERFHESLFAEGRSVLKEVQRKGSFAVVLASRPYQNDDLVNHRISRMFTSMGIPVLTADAAPGVNQVDLSRSRLDIVNNFHARMLGSAVIASQSPFLEYVQLVSFGCGHDAYLTDEIIRLMDEISGKTPLVLKMDESDVPGPLGIRVRSFAETVRMRRKRAASGEDAGTGVKILQDPYPVKFVKKDVKERVVLVPNTSHAFCEILSAAFRTQHIRAVPLPVGYEEAAQYGKRYVHNDICFPAQVVIGEILSALKSGKYEKGRVAVAMAKYIGDCRLTHYSALLRKALDDAGFREVPIITNDQEDARGLHPGFRMNLLSQARLVFALPMIDVLEELLRKTRPYELEKGSADRSFHLALREVIQGLDGSPGIRGLKEGFRKAIGIMNGIRCDFSRKKPTVLIVGEYLLNFHPGANHEIERYLEKNGFEVIEARMTDVIRKTYFYQNAQVKEYHIKKSFRERTMLQIQDSLFNLAQDVTDAIAEASPLYRPAARMQDISFILLQPFGCLPNHVVGRGIAKKLKEIYPDARILPLDFDPDVSAANLENRLQMLIMDGIVKAS